MRLKVRCVLWSNKYGIVQAVTSYRKPKTIQRFKIVEKKMWNKELYAASLFQFLSIVKVKADFLLAVTAGFLFAFSLRCRFYKQNPLKSQYIKFQVCILSLNVYFYSERKLLNSQG